MDASAQDFIPLIPWVGGLLATLGLWAASRAARRQRLVEDLPTSKTTGVFIGYVELHGASGPDHHGVTHQLQVLAEQYPQLQSQRSFQELHQNLVDTEQRIALARSYFNDIATFYNTRLERVPDRFVASLAGLTPQPLLSAMDFEREPVQVALAP